MTAVILLFLSETCFCHALTQPEIIDCFKFIFEFACSPFSLSLFGWPKKREWKTKGWGEADCQIVSLGDLMQWTIVSLPVCNRYVDAKIHSFHGNRSVFCLPVSIPEVNSHAEIFRWDELYVACLLISVVQKLKQCFIRPLLISLRTFLSYRLSKK